MAQPPDCRSDRRGLPTAGISIANLFSRRTCRSNGQGRSGCSASLADRPTIKQTTVKPGYSRQRIPPFLCRQPSAEPRRTHAGCPRTDTTAPGLRTKIVRPSLRVSVSLLSANASGFTAVGSAERISKSAGLPGSRLPFVFSSKCCVRLAESGRPNTGCRSRANWARLPRLQVLKVF